MEGEDEGLREAVEEELGVTELVAAAACGGDAPAGVKDAPPASEAAGTAEGTSEGVVPSSRRPVSVEDTVPSKSIVALPRSTCGRQAPPMHIMAEVPSDSGCSRRGPRP